MKQPILFSLIFLALSAYGQTTKLFPSEIKSKKTNKHVNIPGTKLFIIPPKNFQFMPGEHHNSKMTSGAFQNNNKEGIIISVSLEGQKQAEIDKGFFELTEKMEAKAKRVFDRGETTVDGYAAKYLFAQIDSASKLIIMVFGDTTVLGSLFANYKADNKQTEDEIIKSILSINYDEKFIIDTLAIDRYHNTQMDSLVKMFFGEDGEFNMLAMASFKLDDSNSKFKFAKGDITLFHYQFFYSLNGVEKDNYGKEPLFTVSQRERDKSKEITEELKIMAENSKTFTIEGASPLEHRNTSFKKVNGYHAYTTEITGFSNGEQFGLYVLVVANKDHTLTLIGKALSDVEENMIEFRKLARTITFKPEFKPVSKKLPQELF